MEIEKLKYPVGRFDKPAEIHPGTIEQWIREIEQFPAKLEKLTAGLTAQQLGWRYRPDGWTIKQVVHHCADSHMNSLVRFKLSVTEDLPVIKPYFEDRWAELPDSTDDNISHSLILLRGLHARWANLLHNLEPADLKRAFIHPEQQKQVTVEENIGMYAWHCRHHQAHIEQALNYAGRFNEL